MRTTTKLATLLIGSAAAALLAAAPAFAGEESPICDPEVSECGGGPSGPPQLPSLPASRSVGGDFFVQTGSVQNNTVLEGQIRNDTYFTFGGGPSKPLPTPGGLTLGQADNQIALQSTFTPLASVSASALTAVPQDPNYPGFDLVARGGIGISYLIDLHANNQAAADALTNLLNTSGSIANIHGSWSLTATGSSWGSASVSTGTSELDRSLAGVFSRACSPIGYSGSPAGCGSGSYTVALNFVSGSAYQDGGAMDFYSLIDLSVDANAGPPGLGYGSGAIEAYLDPDIFFNPNLDLSQYSLTVGGTDMSLVAGPGGGAGGVPEPAEWALMLAGFGGLGAMLRRRRALAPAA